MKIAVISDIHGNLQALESVLKDIKTQNCDRIFCLGDLAMAGPQPAETVEKFCTLSNSKNFEIIQGNTDMYLGENSDKMAEIIRKGNVIMANAYQADRSVLSSAQIEFLKNLPPQKQIEIGNLKILLVHGSPRANNENIFPSMPIEEVEKMLEGVDADLIFCGHTHQPCGYQTNTGQTVVNVGSVGRPLSSIPKACYAVLELINPKSKEYNIEHRLVDYDKEKAAQILEARGFEGSDKLAAMLLSASERYPS